MFSMGEVRRHWEEAEPTTQPAPAAPPFSSACSPRVCSHFSPCCWWCHAPPPWQCQKSPEPGGLYRHAGKHPGLQFGSQWNSWWQILLLIWRRENAPRRRWRICRLPAVETLKRTAERPPTPFFHFWPSHPVSLTVRPTFPGPGPARWSWCLVPSHA